MIHTDNDNIGIYSDILWKGDFIMTFYEVLPALKEGKKIRKTRWDKDHYIFYTYRIKWQDGRDYPFGIFDFEDDTWEIIPDPVPKKVKLRDLTKKQYQKRYKKCCKKFGKYCNGCPFQKVQCYNDERLNNIWYLNKDLYSDEFLDQEIEIEED